MMVTTLTSINHIIKKIRKEKLCYYPNNPINLKSLPWIFKIPLIARILV